MCRIWYGCWHHFDSSLLKLMCNASVSFVSAEFIHFQKQHALAQSNWISTFTFTFSAQWFLQSPLKRDRAIWTKKNNRWLVIQLGASGGEQIDRVCSKNAWEARMNGRKVTLVGLVQLYDLFAPYFWSMAFCICGGFVIQHADAKNFKFHNILRTWSEFSLFFRNTICRCIS